MKNKKILAIILSLSMVMSLFGCSLFQKKVTEDDFYDFIAENDIEEVDYDDVEDIAMDDYDDGYYFECDYDDYYDWYDPGYDIEEFDHAIVIANKSATIVLYYFDDNDGAMEFLEDTADNEMDYIEAYSRDDDDWDDEEYVIDGNNGYLLIHFQYGTGNIESHNYFGLYVFGNIAIAVNTTSNVDGYKKYLKNFCEYFEVENPMDMDERRIDY